MAREVKVSGRTVYLPDREEWEEVKADGPNTWLEGPLKCSGCGFCVGIAEAVVGLIHWRAVDDGWERCGEWVKPGAHRAGVSAPMSNGSAPPNDVPPGSLYPEHGHDMRTGPYALTVEVSGFVEHELRCSECGEAPPSTLEYPSQHHFVPVPGGWRKCGDWR